MTRLAVINEGAQRRLVAVIGDKTADVARRLAAHGLSSVDGLNDFIARGPGFWSAAGEALQSPNDDSSDFDESSLAAPIIPEAIVCGGANFHDHLRETGRSKPDRVEFFFKSPTTVIGPRADVRMDRQLSLKYDYEVELGIVIGRSARHVSAADALSHIFGYCALNDVSIRDHQIVLDDDGTSHGRFGQGTFRDACPIGPWIVTADEVKNQDDLKLSTRVDEELRQQSTMSDAIWNVAELVAYYSSVLTLHPGWVIACGTPGGPALGSDVELRANPYSRTDGVERGGYVQPGQLVECRIEGIGSLANRYVLEE